MPLLWGRFTAPFCKVCPCCAPRQCCLLCCRQDPGRVKTAVTLLMLWARHSGKGPVSGCCPRGGEGGSSCTGLMPGVTPGKGSRAGVGTNTHYTHTGRMAALHLQGGFSQSLSGHQLWRKESRGKGSAGPKHKIHSTPASSSFQMLPLVVRCPEAAAAHAGGPNPLRLWSPGLRPNGQHLFLRASPEI